MIKKLAIMLFLLNFYTIKSQSNLGAFVRDSNLWYNYGGSGTFNNQYMRYHRFYFYEGDTIVGSNVYKKMYKILKDSLFYTNGIFPPIQMNYPVSYEAAFRQDDQKVYAIMPNSSIEILYIDFNMNIGDTVKYYPFGNSIKTVISIDSVFFAGQYRRKIGTTGGVFYDGIGHQYGIFRDNSIGIEGGDYLSCFHQYNETQDVYTWGGYHPCYDLNSRPALIISPNPDRITCKDQSTCIYFSSNNPSANYIWNINNVPSNSGIPNSGYGTLCYSNLYSHSSTDTLQVIVKPCLNGDCGTADTFFVFLTPQININQMPDFMYCSGTIPSISFQNFLNNTTQTNWSYYISTSVNSNTESSFYSYSVPQNGQNTIPTFNSFNNSTINFNHHEFHINSRDIYGCWKKDTFDIIILPGPNVQAGEDLTVCYGHIVTLSGTGAATYQWNNGVINDNPFYAVNTREYIVLGTDSVGCQNKDTILVTVLNMEYIYENAVACGMYSWYGQTYYESGTYSGYFTDPDGCTFYGHLNLTINHSISSTWNMSSCGPYTWNGNTYNSSGIYTSFYQNQFGCDSIVTLVLTINNSEPLSQTITLCAGETYTIGNSTYSEAGVYTDVLTNSSGCNYSVTTNLVVLDPLVSSQNITICNGETYYSLLGTPYTSTGIYEEVILSATGCDSTIITNLTVQPPINVSTTINNSTITVTETNATYFWMNCDNNQILLETSNNSFTVPFNGEFRVIVTKNDCSAMSECVTVNTINLFEINQLPIDISPNPTNSEITISSPETISNLKIYQLDGKLVYENNELFQSKTLNISHFLTGTYLLKAHTNAGTISKQIIKL